MKKQKDRLTSAQYWEWRTTISERECAEEKLKKTLLEVKLLQKESELFSANSRIYLLSNVSNAKKEVEKANAEYERFKKVLEEYIGESLNDKMIDEITYEIKKAPSA